MPYIYSCTVHYNSSHLSNEVSRNVTEVAILYGNVFNSVLEGSEKLLIVFSSMNKDPAVILSYFIIKMWFLPMVEVNSIGMREAPAVRQTSKLLPLVTVIQTDRLLRRHSHTDSQTPSVTVKQTSKLRRSNRHRVVRVRVRVTLRLTVSQSVCFGVEPRLGLMTKYLFD
jgi:hypothetical protein